MARVARLAVLGLLLMAAPAQAEPLGEARTTWVPNGEVHATAISGSTAYIGGTFSRVAPYTGGSVRIDKTTAKSRTPWPPVDGTVDAIAADGSGGYYLGGQFTAVGGVARRNLAHVRADGAVDPAFAPTTNGRVRTLAVRSTDVFAGGFFTEANGQPRSFLAAFNPANGALQTFTGQVTNASQHFCTSPDSAPGVHTLAIQGPILYVGGIFDTAHGPSGPVTRNSLAAFTIDTGGVTAFNPDMRPSGSQFNQPVYSLDVDGADVFVAGCFLSVNGGFTARTGVAALNATSGAVTSWTPQAPCCGSGITSVAVTATGVYVAGSSISTGPGQPTRLAVKLNRSLGDFVVWEPPIAGTSGGIRAVAVDGSSVYLAGRFTSSTGAERANLAAYDATTAQPTAWAPSIDQRVSALDASGTDVVAGGSFTVYGGVKRRNLAAIDLNTGEATAFEAALESPQAEFQFIDALAIAGGAVWAGGAFETTDGTRTYLAAFDPVTGAQAPFRRKPNAPVQALAASGSQVFVGGSFSTIGSENRKGAAAVSFGEPGDADGVVLRFNPDVTGSVRALAVAGPTVYLGGQFSDLNGTLAARNNLAAVRAENGDVTAFNPNVNGTVHALVTDGSTVFAGGGFSTVNGETPRVSLAALDAQTGTARPWRADANAQVDALALQGTSLVTGGLFTTLAGNPRPGLGALDASSAALDGWVPPLVPIPARDPAAVVAPQVRAITTDPTMGAVVGGKFLTAPAPLGQHLLSLRPAPPSPSPSPSPGPGTTTPPTPDTTKPVLKLTASRRTFRPTAKRTAPTGRAIAAAKRPARGTTLRLTLSEAATVRFEVLATSTGRRVGKTCRKLTTANRKRTRCTRFTLKGRFTRTAPRGRSNVAFTGRLTKKALRGRFTIRATATDAAGNRGTARPLLVRVTN